MQFVEINKANDSDWFKIESNEEGTRWFGTCWHVYNHVKYEFEVEFDIPATYPTTAPEIELPQLDGKTAKMYRGGKICLTDHFFPLWAKNAPKFGIVHALALGVRITSENSTFVILEKTLPFSCLPAPSCTPCPKPDLLVDCLTFFFCDAKACPMVERRNPLLSR